MSSKAKRKALFRAAIQKIRRRGGIIRMSEALLLGISRTTLYSLLHREKIERVSRGIYRLTDLPPISNPDLAIVALRVPRAVMCLVSALAFHDLTTQVPNEVAIALEKGAEAPRIEHPPISVHRFSSKALEAGVEKHVIDGVTVRVYSPEKTLVDCFKFRNQVGMDLFLEALKFYKQRRPFKPDLLLGYARICRVEKAIRPYLEVSV